VLALVIKIFWHNRGANKMARSEKELMEILTKAEVLRKRIIKFVDETGEEEVLRGAALTLAAGYFTGRAARERGGDQKYLVAGINIQTDGFVTAAIEAFRGEE
jgi:hypothetical protein